MLKGENKEDEKQRKKKKYEKPIGTARNEKRQT